MIYYKNIKGAFLLDVYKSQGLPSILCSNVSYKIGRHKGIFPIEEQSSSVNHKRNIFSLSYIPEYVTTELDEKKRFKSNTFKSVKGYSVRLGEYGSFKDFLASMQAKRRQALSRSLRRLDSCFDINYHMFHGNISEDSYNYLMDSLKKMIAKRFEQRPENSETLVLWDKIYSTSFRLINESKASLYVAYNEEKPIFISLNYHFDKILFGYVSSYDIDYGKFSLGQICIYKHIEWCLSNGYILFELGWGDLEYKKWWSNNTYNFKSQIVFPKNSPLAYAMAHYYGYKTELIAFLISKKVNIHLRKLKSLLRKNGTASEQNGPSHYYKLDDIEPKHIEIEKSTPIPLESSNIPKSIVYEFLFLSQTKISNITIYPLADGKNYIISGNKMSKKIVYSKK